MDLFRKHREEWIDAAKGLGITLIVVGHVWSLSEPPLFYEWLFAFHVPLFFFIAGLTLTVDGRQFGAFVAGKARVLLIPYAYYALLGYLFFLGGYIVAQALGVSLEQFDYGLWVPLFGILHGTVGDGYLVNSPLWFLPALFFTLLMAFVVNCQVSASWARWLIILGILLLGMAIGERWRIPWGVVPAMIALVFLQAGVEFRQRGWNKHLTRARLSVLLGVSALLSLFAPINGAVGLAGPTVNNPLWFMLFAFVGIAMCMAAVLLPIPGRALVAVIGRYSLIILVVHMLVIKAVKVVLLVFSGVPLGVMEQSIGWGLLILLVSGLIMWPLVWGIDRWLGFTLGRGIVKASGVHG